MRTKFFAIAALVLGLASCQKDFAPEANLGGEVDYSIAVSAPELGATRAAKDGTSDNQEALDSAFGGVDYFQGTDWSKVDLRYTLEVYDADEYGVATNPTPVKDRMVKVFDSYEQASFSLRLIQNRDYRFVVFADFVADGAATAWTEAEKLTNDGLNHRIGATLANIELINEDINEESADAYFAGKHIKPTNASKNTDNIELTRPYAKVRVVATDLAEINNNVTPAKVTVEYSAPNANIFNAVTGTFDGAYETKSFTRSYTDPEASAYTAGYDSDNYVDAKNRNTHMTIFTDYILAGDSQETIQFQVSVYDEQQIIKTTNFNTEIPVQRNFLTTIIGNVLTTATEINVTIDDNFASEYNEEGVNLKERILLETLINGGKYTLTEDLTLTAPHYLEGTIECAADAVIDLNGHTLKYEIPSDVQNDNRYAIFVRVLDNASLTFVGEGAVISDGYIASVNEGGVLTVSEGLFETNSCTVFQSNGGEINIFGGEFKAAPYNGDHRYTINFVDSMKQEGLIEISGGRFYKYNPEESLSESPAMNFVAAGYTAIENGDYFDVVVAKNIDLFADHAEVYSAQGLLQWAYIVNNGAISAFEDLQGYDAATFDKNAYGLKVMANIKMPAKTIVADAAKETYVFTDEVITVTDGVASGSNWIPVCGVVNDYPDGYRGWVDGQNKKISGLRINTTSNYVGLIGFTYDFDGGFVKDLTFNDAVIKGNTLVGAAVGNAQNGVVVENIHVTNSTIEGTEMVGAITGRVYHRTQLASGEWKNEKMAYVVECSTDENTTVEGDHNIGGIAGRNYGCVIGNCVSNATVIGRTQVGGIVGSHCSYFRYADGYVIGCVSTDKAIVKATNGYAGGIAGHTLRDNSSHLNTRGWIIGCTSLAQVNAKNAASFIGNCGKNNGLYGNCIAASYAVTNLTDFAKGSAEPQIEAAYNVANVSELTQAHVDAMNAAIEAFNVSPDNIYVNGEVGAVMYKRWHLTANGPVLQ